MTGATFLADIVNEHGPGYGHGVGRELLLDAFATVDELLNFLRENHCALYWRIDNVYGVEKIPDYRYKREAEIQRFANMSDEEFNRQPGIFGSGEPTDWNK